MSELPAGWVYALILVVAWGENVLPPIPGDMIVVFGGYLAGLGRLDLSIVILLSTVGGTLGFMSMYAVGSKLGTALLNPKRFRWLPKKRLLSAREYLGRWGYGLVAANRFLSGLRSVISLSVGMAHKPAWSTTLWATFSALVWTVLLGVAGFYVGENWEVVGEYLRRYGTVVVSLLILFVVVQLVRFWFSRGVPDLEDN
ncbi:MAG: DedA family protein [Rhodothermales bacterium]|nr:DedA family protein [Rhodothermales bacterium]